MGRKRIGILLAVFFIFVGAGMAQAENKKDNPFGVLEFLHWNDSWNNYQYPDRGSLEKAVALMKDAGVGMVRLDFIWQSIEYCPGTVDYAKYDHLVELLERNGIQILGILDYAADWDSPQKQWNFPNPDHSAFIRYACGVVRRYQGRIKYWEVWNEPDSSAYWNPQDGMKDYVRLLKEVYPELKRSDPACLVLNGGLANGPASVNRLYDNGAGGYFDIMNVHVFQTPLDPEALTRAKAQIVLTRKIMERNGDADKKIWITETGCPGVRKPEKPANWWLGKNPTEEQQAEWAKDILGGLLQEKSVEKIFWAFFRDTNAHWKNGTDYLGLVRSDFSRKPAFEAYKRAFRDWSE